MEKLIMTSAIVITALTVLMGVSAFKAVNDGRIQTVVTQIVLK